MAQRPPLASVASVAIDTSPFIYLIEGKAPREQKAVALFKEIEQAQKLTSIITPIEVLAFCSGPSGAALAEKYRDYFRRTPGLQVRTVDWQVAEAAAEVRAKYGLRTPDAIQVATALVNEADVFITNDRRLAGIENIPVIIFDEWTP